MLGLSREAAVFVHSLGRHLNLWDDFSAINFPNPDATDPVTGSYTYLRSHPYQYALMTALKREREMRDWFVVYHAVRNDTGFLYDVASMFRNVMGFYGSDNFNSFRMLDTFFKDLEGVQDFLDDEIKRQGGDFTGLDNYRGQFQEKGLSVNIFLFGSKDSNRSSTFKMFSYRDTADLPGLPNFDVHMRYLLSQFGADDAVSLQEYRDLYTTFFPGQGALNDGTNKSGELYQIFINPDDVDDVLYLSLMMGRGLFATAAEQRQKYAPKRVLTLMRQSMTEAETERGRLGLSAGAHGNNDFQNFQARLLLKPSIMSDPTKVRIEKYYTRPPNDGYQEALRRLVERHITRFLLRKLTFSPGVFETSTGAQAVYGKILGGYNLSYDTTLQQSLYGMFVCQGNEDGIIEMLKSPRVTLNFFAPIAIPDKFQNPLAPPPTDPLIVLSGKLANSAELRKAFVTYKPAETYTAITRFGVNRIAKLAMYRGFVEKGDDTKYAEAKVAADASLAMGINGEERACAINLYADLAEKGQFTDAERKAQEAVGNADMDVLVANLRLIRVLVENGRFYVQADAEITRIMQGRDINRKAKAAALAVRQALFAKKQYIDNAFRDARNGIENGDSVVVEKALELWQTLASMPGDPTRAYRDGFATLISCAESPDDSVRSAVVKLSGILLNALNISNLPKVESIALRLRDNLLNPRKGPETKMVSFDLFKDAVLYELVQIRQQRDPGPRQRFEENLFRIAMEMYESGDGNVRSQFLPTLSFLATKDLAGKFVEFVDREFSRNKEASLKVLEILLKNNLCTGGIAEMIGQASSRGEAEKALVLSQSVLGTKVIGPDSSKSKLLNVALETLGKSLSGYKPAVSGAAQDPIVVKAVDTSKSLMDRLKRQVWKTGFAIEVMKIIRAANIPDLTPLAEELDKELISLDRKTALGFTALISSLCDVVYEFAPETREEREDDQKHGEFVQYMMSDLQKIGGTVGHPALAKAREIHEFLKQDPYSKEIFDEGVYLMAGVRGKIY